MKLNKILLLFFITIYGCAKEQEIVNYKALVNDNNVFNIDGNIYSGICNAYSEDGLVLESKYYKKGKIYKVEGFHSPGGEKKFEGYYKNDLPNGKFKQWWVNGNLERKGRINQGFYVGKWKIYNDKGIKLKTIWFNSQGQINREVLN